MSFPVFFKYFCTVDKKFLHSVTIEMKVFETQISGVGNKTIVPQIDPFCSGIAIKSSSKSHWQCTQTCKNLLFKFVSPFDTGAGTRTRGISCPTTNIESASLIKNSIPDWITMKSVTAIGCSKIGARYILFSRAWNWDMLAEILRHVGFTKIFKNISWSFKQCGFSKF